MPSLKLHWTSALGGAKAMLHDVLGSGRAARRAPVRSGIGVELARLEAALDRLDHGIALLDERRQVRFVNHACRRMWSSADQPADGFPALVSAHLGRDAPAPAVPPVDLDRYIAARADRLVRGDPVLDDVTRADGRVLRIKVAVLPDGGRMLSCHDVTDPCRYAEAVQGLAGADALTGLHNRRNFLDLAETEWRRYARYGHSLSLLMLDIDALKATNARLGHEAGDRAIIKVAEVCRLGKRGTDVLARVGGETFALLLPETPLAMARAVAERLREHIGETPILHAAERFKVTVSIGVSDARIEMLGMADLIGRADEALRAAKRAGRNRVTSYRGAMAA